MSMINRYKFTKGVYSDYIILILKDGKYYSFGDDKRILDYIGFNNKLSILKKKSINFIVLDDLEILGYAKYEISNLYKYLYLSYISDILYKIKRIYLYRIK